MPLESRVVAGTEAEIHGSIALLERGFDRNGNAPPNLNFLEKDLGSGSIVRTYNTYVPLFFVAING